MSQRPNIVVIGEGMLELSRSGADWQLAYGGDTLNMAIHLARLGFPTSYLTALGEDGFSNDLRRAWAAEGLDLSLVVTDPDRRPGLYAISTDETGERGFTYWRDCSAAKRMFELPGSEAATERARKADLLIYSLITVAILPDAGRERLLDLARDVRVRGGRVAFDGNFRPSLWVSKADARAMRDAAIGCCDIGLPTLADEQELSGEADAAEVDKAWRSRGAGEVAVKLGAEGALADGMIVPTVARQVVDTSGAGDAFNSGYLAARLSGAGHVDAALAGNRLAAWVIGQPGAIPRRDDEAPYPSQESARAEY